MSTAAVTNQGKLRAGGRFNLVTVTMDSSYAAGGDAILANGLGLTTITDLRLAPTTDYIPEWNGSPSAPKVVVYPRGTIQKVSEVITFAGATDNTDATGFMDFTTAIPARSLILGWEANTTVAWSGDTTAVIQVGVSGDLDRFSADTTKSVFTAIRVASSAIAADAEDGFASAVTPRVTITGGSDFGALNTLASTTVTIYYIDTSTSEIRATTDLTGVVFTGHAIGV
jgi:hypothetical protein